MMRLVKKLACWFIAAATFGLFSCPVKGQELPKRQLTPDDYKLWENLRLEGISAKGNWVSYTKTHNSGKFILYIKNVKTNLEMAFPGAAQGQFAGEHTFACLDNETLKIVSLSNAKTREIAKVASFGFSADGQWLVVESSRDPERKHLYIYDRNGDLKHELNNVSGYEWNTQKDRIVFSYSSEVGSTVGILNLREKITAETVSQPIGTVGSLRWNRSGTAVAFCTTQGDAQSAANELSVFRLSGRRLHTLNSKQAGAPIAEGKNYKLAVSDDAKKVFFEIAVPNKVNPLDTASVEIWRSDDKAFPAVRKRNATLRAYALSVWWVDTGKVTQVNDSKHTWVTLAGTSSAIIADPLKNEPSYRLNSELDLLLVDLVSGRRLKILERQNWEFGAVSVSPGIKYVTYYNDSDWWVSDTESGTHINATQGLSVAWTRGGKNEDDEHRLFGNAGWSIDQKWVLFYDKNDIWAISPETKEKKRLTKGAESGLRFRFASLPETWGKPIYSAVAPPVFDLAKKYLLEATSLIDGSSGYYLLNFNSGAKRLVWQDAETSDLRLSADRTTIAYIEQSFSSPPAIKCKIIGNPKETLVVQSNSHHQKFEWGYSQMINYTNSKGEDCNGALFYPAGFVHGKKYPMVVYIYDTVSRELHHYVNPSLENPTGFNVANLTANGYFVLKADIVYELGNTGISATDCVVAAVSKVVGMGVVDPARVGLYGHSFGGYEASSIITHTGIFAAAVSGSSVADIVSQYLSYNAQYSSGNAWRFEYQQYRMGKSFYDDRVAYHRNSPVEQAANIKTPLLTWTGSKDANVPSAQLMELYMAMRRLGKKNIMLVYPDGHIFKDKEYQEDLTCKLEEWFDYYLKDGPLKLWMVAEGS